MPPVPEDKIYQVWVIEDDVPKPSGLFEPGQEDPVAAVVEHSVESDDAVAVTVESRGGFTQADQRSHAGGQSLNYSKVSTTRRVIDQDMLVHRGPEGRNQHKSAPSSPQDGDLIRPSIP